MGLGCGCGWVDHNHSEGFSFVGNSKRHGTILRSRRQKFLAQSIFQVFPQHLEVRFESIPVQVQILQRQGEVDRNTQALFHAPAESTHGVGEAIPVVVPRQNPVVGRPRPEFAGRFWQGQRIDPRLRRLHEVSFPPSQTIRGMRFPL